MPKRTISIFEEPRNDWEYIAMVDCVKEHANECYQRYLESGDTYWQESGDTYMDMAGDWEDIARDRGLYIV